MKRLLFGILLITGFSAIAQQDSTEVDIDFDETVEIISPRSPPPGYKVMPKRKIQYDSNHCLIGVHQAYPQNQKHDSLYLSNKFWKEIETYVHQRMSPSDTVEGKVIVTFSVDTLGVLYDIKIARGLNPKLDSLAIEGLKDLGDWCPAYEHGKKVKMGMVVVVKVSYKDYYLREEETE